MEENLSWSVTEWLSDCKGGWVNKPVIFIEGQEPFMADTPEEYIVKLQELHDNPLFGGRHFHARMGEFEDASETFNSLIEVAV